MCIVYMHVMLRVHVHVHQLTKARYMYVLYMHIGQILFSQVSMRLQNAERTCNIVTERVISLVNSNSKYTCSSSIRSCVNNNTYTIRYIIMHVQKLENNEGHLLEAPTCRRGPKRRRNLVQFSHKSTEICQKSTEIQAEIL